MAAAVIVMTGESDYLSDGEIVIKCSNGHHLVGIIQSTVDSCPAWKHNWERLHDRNTGGDLLRRCSFVAHGRREATRFSVPACTRRHVGWRTGRVRDSSMAMLTHRVLVFNIAAEIAAERKDVKGPGTFRAALIDELYNLKPEQVQARAKIEIHIM
jgi:thiamine-phosphate diphosphorylase/hydroxyethylthiazole kinase